MSGIDIFVSSTGTFNISILDHMKMLENNAFVGNTGHFVNEFNLPGSNGLEGMNVDDTTPQGLFRLPRRSRCRGLPPAEGAR